MAQGGEQGESPDPEKIVVTLGGAPDNDLVFDRPMISGHHARLVWDGRMLVLEDLDSTNGTTVNGRAVRAAPVRLGDVIGLGSFKITLLNEHIQRFTDAGIKIPGPSTPVPTMAIDLESAQRRTDHEQPPLRVDTVPPGSFKVSRMSKRGDSLEVPPDAPSLSIGYADDNDVVVPMAQVSGHHARLSRVGRRLILEDLGSTNGTHVDGKRIERAEVQAGDEIGLGSYRLKLSRDLVARLGESSAVDSRNTHVGSVPKSLLKPIKIGRDDTPGVNNIVLDAAMVSNEHCELRYTGSAWRLRDLGSTNGTYVNSMRHRVTEANVNPGDVLFFGSYRFPMSRLGDFVPELGTNKGTGDNLRLPEARQVMIIGRDESCDLTIGVPQVSRRHARLKRQEDGFFIIEDLGSANGTFVNGKRIKKATRFGPQDVVSLGGHHLRFDERSGRVARNYHGDIMIQAENITVKVDRGRKTILHNVSFTVYPTEFVGLMGPSGAGKTTLMMALNGYLPPFQGRSLINNTDLYTNYDAFRGNIGYVPQDDIIHSELTVWEALYYTARLRLPPDTRDAEIEAIISDVLRQLEIETTRDTLIGSPERKGISGGQRKRVNLALELITQPSLLFLDEPTSGLAAGDTINVMKLLRRLADDGRTILLTIHQPSLEAYRTMDNVVYLADGHLVYYGPAYPDSILFFHPEIEPGTSDGDRLLADPGNAMVPLDEDRRHRRSMVNRARNYIDSDYFKEYVQRRRAGEGEAVLTASAKRRSGRRFGLRQWWILTRRALTVKLKDVAGTAILLLQAPIIAGIISLVFRAEMGDPFGRVSFAPFALFMLAVSAVWFGCSNAAREIVAEQAIYRRERMVNLKIVSYVMSKFTVLGFICVLQCLMLLSLTYVALGFEGHFVEMFVLLYLCSLSGVGMGLMLSSTVRTSEAAIALVPLLLIPQVILSGLVMPVDKLSKPMQAVSAAMMTRWGFEGLLHAEDRAEAFDIAEADIRDKQEEFEKELRKEQRSGNLGAEAAKSMPQVPVPQHPLDHFFENQTVGTLGDLGALVGFNVLMLLGVIAVLKIRDPDVG